MSSTSPSNTPSMPAHARSMSHADVASRQNKRLSLNFPIQPAAGSIPSTPRSRPASWIGSPAHIPDNASSVASPVSNDGNFLTALAAQERRVLELKEELSKAEERLKELKRQWVGHDTSQKRKDLHGFTPLPPLTTSFSNLGVNDDAADGETNWMHKEMERRKAILHGQRQSSRKVFSGSRHTRALSLLSPAKDLSNSNTDDAQGLTRSSTIPDTPSDATEQEMRDALLRTGKQMATDFKDGLWTFIEDLRQATVGDEGVNGAHGRTGSGQQLQPSGANIGSSSSTSLGRSKSLGHARRPRTTQPSGDGSALIDIEASFWRDNGVEEPTPPQPAVVKSKHAKTPRNRSSQSLEDNWDDWDNTPTEAYKSGHSSANNSISLSEGRTSPPCSERSSPRTSTSSAGIAPLDFSSMQKKSKRVSTGSMVSWPALKTLSPSSLGRAASSLMSEWEKSITSPTEGWCAEAEAMEDYIAYKPVKDSKAE
ncbi:uncharacterized protein K452DRAFT_299521 [Aplosporella prunicola CBS 121167]|uniref:DUF4048 domain-containing protein n=1 Tax=Aplosporella prunicola CBS 121167 TaxID=1176127 RepID=A0A6A6B7I2_9PEZI|nr:uncharacterized protein K452DRAFT_299521 [Aplosporella prunicola CBS 121167]KAF2140122.1 hypothetical protein K452DRAFT_299521 [Aplosporella prunicola CBS 121167]